MQPALVHGHHSKCAFELFSGSHHERAIEQTTFDLLPCSDAKLGARKGFIEKAPKHWSLVTLATVCPKAKVYMVMANSLEAGREATAFLAYEIIEVSVSN